MPTKDPDYNYEDQADKKVSIRFEHVYGHYYVLQFTTDNPRDCSIIGPYWHTVREYVPTDFYDNKPGEGCPNNIYGNWIKRTFYIEDKLAGELMIETLRKHIHAVRDIYTCFIEDGMKRRAADMEHYNKHQESLKILPDFIG